MNIDDAIRRLPLVPDGDARLRIDHAAKAALFEEITAMSYPLDTRSTNNAGNNPGEQSERVSGAAPSRWRRWSAAIVAVAAVGAAGTAITAAVVVRGQQEGNTFAGCSFDDSGYPSTDQEVIWADPVRNCEFAWEAYAAVDQIVDPNAEAGPPPAMTAYRNNDGRIIVIPDGFDVRGDLIPLAPGEGFDPRYAELSAALLDTVDGSRSNCFTGAAARELADREIARLGLGAELSVSDEGGGGADGVATCAEAGYNASWVTYGEDRRVVLRSRAVDEYAPSAWLQARSAELRLQTVDSCLSLSEADSVTRTILGFPAQGVTGDVDVLSSLATIVDDTKDCAVVDIGYATVLVRGPQG